MTPELQTAQAEFDDVSARLNTLSANKDKLDIRQAKIEGRRAALAAERVSANLIGKAFTKAAELREVTEELEGVNEALSEMTGQVGRTKAEFNVKAKTLRQRKMFYTCEGRVDQIGNLSAECQQAFQTGLEKLRAIHTVSDRIEADLSEVGVTDAFPSTRLRNRLGDRLARLFARNLGGDVYGSMVYQAHETIEGGEDWASLERALLTRELQGVENGLRLGLIAR